MRGMHTNITVTPDTLIHDAQKLMHYQKMRCLPVIQGNKLLGIITQDDIREATSSPVCNRAVVFGKKVGQFYKPIDS